MFRARDIVSILSCKFQIIGKASLMTLALMGFVFKILANTHNYPRESWLDSEISRDKTSSIKASILSRRSINKSGWERKNNEGGSGKKKKNKKNKRERNT